MEAYKNAWSSVARLWNRNAGAAPEAAAHDPAQAAEEDRHFLPNFCHGEVVLNVALIAQMLALVITLLTRRIFLNVFVDLIMISMLVQWIALTSVAALCYARPHLSRLSHWRAIGAAYLLLLAVTVVVGELALWTAALAGLINSAHPEWYSYFHAQNLTVSAIVNAFALRYFLAKHELKQRTLSEARARIAALQSRIRPHFLFNSMNIIASLIRTAPGKAEAAIEDMADLFRMMLADENLVPVRNEIEVAKKYLSMEALRLDNRLRLDWDVGKLPRKASIPVLTLQPLLENAIHYGIEPAATGGALKIKIWEEGEQLRIDVRTGLPGGASRVLKDQDTALDNMRQRLEGHYGTAAQLSVTKEGGEYLISVRLPARGGKA